MKRFWIGAGLLSLGAAFVQHLFFLQSRLDALEESPRVEPHSVLELQGKLQATRTELTQAVSRARSEFRNETQQRRSRMRAIEAQLGVAGDKLAAQHTRLASWEARWADQPAEIEDRLRELNERLEREATELEQLVELSQGHTPEPALVSVDTSGRDTQTMWKELVGPVVQLSGDTTVGSGILLESRRIADTTAWRTYIITSWHVVRDVYASGDRTRTVPVKLYKPNGTHELESALLVEKNADLDIALLELSVERRIPYAAALAPRTRLDEVEIFDRVYAVGCPLGNDPIPTAGEVASTFHEVDGEDYWMISAPTYIGNSGGGIFDAETHELLGVFSKIYTHGSLRSSIVPHMGLATPLPEIYAWLHECGYGDLEPKAGEARVASVETDF